MYALVTVGGLVTVADALDFVEDASGSVAAY